MIINLPNIHINHPMVRLIIIKKKNGPSFMIIRIHIFYFLELNNSHLKSSFLKKKMIIFKSLRGK
jgi:hypothetical protein